MCVCMSALVSCPRLILTWKGGVGERAVMMIGFGLETVDTMLLSRSFCSAGHFELSLFEKLKTT